MLDIKFVGRTSRGHTGFLIHLLFAVRALIFLASKDSAIPFPRRPLSRILCTDDLIVLHPLGIFIFIFHVYRAIFIELAIELSTTGRNGGSQSRLTFS